MRVEVKCPYCGFTNNAFIEKDYWRSRVIICDIDAGGCEKEFVVRTKKEITAETFKIEGEE